MVIETRGLTRCMGMAKRSALDNVDLHVTLGEFVESWDQRKWEKARSSISSVRWIGPTQGEIYINGQDMGEDSRPRLLRSNRSALYSRCSIFNPDYDSQENIEISDDGVTKEVESATKRAEEL